MAITFMSWFFFYFEMYLCWDLFGSWFHFHDWWHGYCWDVFWFSAVTFYVEIFSCMITWWFIRKRDNYFLFIYCNCMIYCLNRNRALHIASKSFRGSTSTCIWGFDLYLNFSLPSFKALWTKSLKSTHC